MATSEGTFGGDGSVAWTVTHDRPFAEIDQNGEKHKLHKRYPNKHAMNVVRRDGFAEGRDPSSTTGRFFRITIQVPKAKDGGEEVIASLISAAINAQTGGVATIDLPILDESPEQIVIDWPLRRRRKRRRRTRGLSRRSGYARLLSLLRKRLSKLDRVRI